MFTVLQSVRISWLWDSQMINWLSQWFCRPEYKKADKRKITMHFSLQPAFNVKAMPK